MILLILTFAGLLFAISMIYAFYMNIFQPEKAQRFRDTSRVKKYMKKNKLSKIQYVEELDFMLEKKLMTKEHYDKEIDILTFI